MKKEILIFAMMVVGFSLTAQSQYEYKDCYCTTVYLETNDDFWVDSIAAQIDSVKIYEETCTKVHFNESSNSFFTLLYIYGCGNIGERILNTLEKVRGDDNWEYSIYYGRPMGNYQDETIVDCLIECNH